ncbi:UNVERIFIED_CONTAM: Katanin p80 WD40 repeat-containing subunit B1 [Sesamum radiatum]|uniref:Katanin p80 WD40 repeat-containing subunit B1 homolog n=1 Tax=Sesamum radiatum TaxID=300843 RepID=A0AAW2KFY9_SESRA
MSLCGHTSPVESAAFDSAEVLVVAGSSSGAIKLWDLEETKMVRTLSGHRSYCTAVEFHPFGEFFASGSMDTNLKIWDIRKKGCIHTYKGHTRGISTIRFTPDGRWVVSGGFDNVVKVWDLTAGKLLHDFKFHEGHIRSIEFHPLEFLLATGSADKTVKFWDLETFEMIGSARREATGVRAITFHPDGRTLFCGLDDALKLIEPYGTRLAPEQHNQSEQKCDTEQRLMEKEESHVKLKSNLRSTTPDSDSKEIKTIYVDRVNSVTSKTVEPVDVPKVVHPSDSKEISTVGIQKRGPQTSLPAKSNAPAVNRSLIMPSIVPRDGPDGKIQLGPEGSPLPRDSNVRNRLVADENAKESSEEKQQSNIKTAAEKIDRTSPPATAPSDQILNSSKGVNSVKVVNGGKIDVDEIYTPNMDSGVPGEPIATPLSQVEPSSGVPAQPVSTPASACKTPLFQAELRYGLPAQPVATPPSQLELSSGVPAQPVKIHRSQNSGQQIALKEQSTLDDNNVIENLMQNHDVLLSTFRSRLTKLQVVRHFWERNDVKGAINAVKKLPDHSVQADVVGVLIERMEVITLDLFCCLLPVLLGLLDSKVERHASVSLEMLLKLVAVFGTVVRSTVSAPPAVGVDLHAEERLECCKRCFAHLQNVQKMLPELVKRGGVVARYSQQLNLVIRQT